MKNIIITDYNMFIKMIKEGLIMSHDIFRAGHILNTELLKNDINHKIVEKDNNTLKLTLFNKLNIDLLELLMLLTNNLGYFPSKVYLKTKNMEYNYPFDYNKLKNDINKNLTEMTLILESTFDKLIDKPPLVYHVTRNSYLNKIKKYGLVAKSEEKITYHPERIYLSFKLNYCYDLIERFKRDDKLNPNKLIDFRNKKGFNIDYYNFTVFKIDLVNLNIKLYRDPNFSEKGCYTYDNIPYENIEIL